MKSFDKTESINIEDIDIEKIKKEKVEKKSFEDEMVDFLSEDEPIEKKEDKEETIYENPEFKGETVIEKDISNEEEKFNSTAELEELENFKGKTKELEELPESISEELVEDSGLIDIVKNDFQEKTITDVDVPESKKIGIASDHRGYKLKQKLTKYLNKKGYTVVDYGCDAPISCDYPEFGFKLGEAVANYEVEKGIAICGSGIGISIACNKIKGVRCAKVNNTKEVKYTRHDNDANIIALAADTPVFRAKDIVDVYLKTPFSGMDRHQKRIDMLNSKG